MNKIAFWGILLLVTSTFLYMLSDTLSPFVISFIFAYLLEPIIENNYRRFKISRASMTLSVFVIFLSSLAFITILLVPVIYQQIAIFLSKVPQYKMNFESGVLEWSDKLKLIDPALSLKISEFAKNLINSAFSLFSSFADYVWQYTLATINFFAIVALVPIILFYFLRDWPNIVSSVESILPIKGKSKVREIFASINELLSAYIRGQLNICLILAIYYFIGFYIIGLDLALLLGIISGFFIIIPFIGVLLSFSLVMIIAYFVFGATIELGYITMLFVVGHVIEAYILTPKIIGNRIGLHPVWIIFAVFIAANLFGIVGIMLAIPIAGIIKVFLGYMIDYYKSSNMYKN